MFISFLAPLLGALVGLLIPAAVILIIGPRVVVGRKLLFEFAWFLALCQIVLVAMSVVLYQTTQELEKVETGQFPSFRLITWCAIALVALVVLGGSIAIVLIHRKQRETIFFFRIPTETVGNVLRDCLRQLSWRGEERPTQAGWDYVMDNGTVTVRHERIRLRMGVNLSPSLDRAAFLTALHARLLADQRLAGAVIRLH